MAKLFELEKNIPQWIADYFYLANSGIYSGKQSFYSDVKPVILEKFAMFDGYDQQIIKKQCWSCNGTGIYTHTTYHYPGGNKTERTEPCYSCIKGIYSTRQYFLQRYILNETVYHIPCSEPVVGPVKNRIDGIIKHEAVDSQKAYRAYIILLFLYNKGKFYHIVKDMIKEEVRLRTTWKRQLIQKLFAYENTADDLPF